MKKETHPPAHPAREHQEHADRHHAAPGLQGGHARPAPQHPPAKPHPPVEDPLIAAHKKVIAQHMGEWLGQLRTHGIVRSQPINPLGVEAAISSGFGFRDVEHISGATGVHLGIDLVPHDKSLRTNGHAVPILNAVKGHVLFAGNCDKHSGYSIIIGGENGKIYSYAHLNPKSIKVHAGQDVAMGARIADMGSSGTASSPCLHFVERHLKALDAASFTAHEEWQTKENAFIADTKKHHKPGEKRVSPPTTPFDGWSWKHAVGAEKDHIPANIVGQALDWAQQHLNEGKPITSLDMFDRAPPRIFWTVNPYAAGKVRANTPEDLGQKLTPQAQHHRVNPPEQSWGEYLYHGVQGAVKGLVCLIPGMCAPEPYHVVVPLPPRPPGAGHRGEQTRPAPSPQR